MKIYVNGKLDSIDPKQPLAEGHEARIFPLKGDDKAVVKLYRHPSDPLYQLDPSGQEAALERLKTCEKKLRSFPSKLPERAVGPRNLVFPHCSFFRRWLTRNPFLGLPVLGYEMERVYDAEIFERCCYLPHQKKQGLTEQQLVKMLLDLHRIVEGLHKCGIVIGDFNWKNVLIKGQNAFVIDLDAAQFETPDGHSFLCNTFEPDFLDPLLMDPKSDSPMLDASKAYNTDSDWYAFNALVMSILTCINPYSGVYQGVEVEHNDYRAHKRISVFHGGVKIRRGPHIKHWSTLPKDLLAYLKRVFSPEDLRGTFPRSLLENMLPKQERPQKVDVLENLLNPPPKVDIPRWPKPLYSKTVEAFECQIIAASQKNFVKAQTHGSERLLFLEFIRRGKQRGDYVRENGQVIVANETRKDYLKVGARRFYFFRGVEETITVLGKQGLLFFKNGSSQRFQVDSFGDIPALDAQGDNLVYFHDGSLYFSDGEIDKAHILLKNPNGINFPWVHPNGQQILCYDRSAHDVGLLTRSPSLNVKTLKLGFSPQHPPEILRPLWPTEEQGEIWILSKEGSQVVLRKYERDGTYCSSHSFSTKWFTPGSKVCRRNNSLMVTQNRRLYMISPETEVRKKLLKLPFSDGVEQILPHPHDEQGLVILVTLPDIWEIKT